MLGLPVELWGESILKKLLKQIGKAIKIDIGSEEVTKGRFARVYVEVDISKPLKVELKYKRGNVTKSAFIDNENSIDICYGNGQQDHKFKNCPLYPKSIKLRLKGPKGSSIPKDSVLANKQDMPLQTTSGLRLNPRGGKGQIWENLYKKIQEFYCKYPRKRHQRQGSSL